MKFDEHALYKEMVALGIVRPEAVVEFFPRVQDRDDVRVLRCERSGVIFLSRIDHIATSYYSEMSDLSYWSKEGRADELRTTFEDDSRRARMINDLVRGRSVVDVGSGTGGVLDLLKPQASEVLAVEPQKAARAMLTELGYSVFANADELKASGRAFDVITLFHVFEHLVEPLAELRRLYDCLAPGGSLVIEVPQARDALITTYDIEAFKRFTFWSEHLVLHTRESLEKYLRAAGFQSVHVQGLQRYPLANHLYWLREGKPGGQKIWAELRDPTVEEAYSTLLDRLDRTDTLWAVARKG